jgi:eukaryotic-like serine/threonine-protein kinase
MSMPSSVDELIQLISKSGMVEENKLSNYVHKRQAGRGLPSDPREAGDAMIADGLITSFQAEQFLLGKWRGFTVGKYKLLERVGVGGMGQVFLCEHMFMKRRVAIKVLPPAKAEQPAALGRFYREARAAGSLDHPNIVRTHDIDQDGNLHFIVMEYVDGTNLLDVVKRYGPMNIHRATHYIRQVALGLDYAFRGGIIHRDIKPGNILIDRHGTAKLLDLGLARFYHDQTDMLTVKYDDKVVLGTADYVAPEQVANSHAVDVRADIYALGASLYYLLAGHPPFPTGTVSQKLLWHRTKDPTPIRQVRPEVPEGLAALVTKMMQKDPAARYQTPQEVADELEQWVPVEVPLPAPEEMPKLSPAASENLESSNSQNGSDSAVDLKKKQSTKSSPFGPQQSDRIPVSGGQSPFGVGSGGMVATATSKAVQSGPHARGVAANTPSPANASKGAVAGLPVQSQSRFPVVARNTKSVQTGNPKPWLVYGLATVALVSVTMLIYKSFFAAAPVPVVQSEQMTNK